MSFATNIDINYAESLVAALQSEDQQKAAEILDEMTKIRESELYQQVSALTANLHQTLDDLDDHTLLMQTKHDIPDATERLEYVIKTTEEASNTTLDTAESALLSLEKVQDQVKSIDSIDQDNLSSELTKVAESLTNIMLAQSFQDLTGQVLNRVIFIISSIEQSLIQLIDLSGHDYHTIPARQQNNDDEYAENMQGVGPNVTKSSKNDIVGSQEDIDDLLGDLGI